jgi:regulator of replication initiation timing
MDFCKNYLMKQSLALINRQKASLQEVITLNSKLEAENAKLQRLLDFYEETSGNKKAKSEAIKEFAERLKANMSNIARMEYGGNTYFCVGYDLIDTLVKEMTETK